MSILLITNIIIKKERNLLFMELLSTAISYLNTYLLEKFSQKNILLSYWLFLQLHFYHLCYGKFIVAILKH